MSDDDEFNEGDRWSPIAQVLFDGIKAQGIETDMPTETALDIIGPVDLEELAEYIRVKLVIPTPPSPIES